MVKELKERLKVEDGKVERKQREKVLAERDGMEQETVKESSVWFYLCICLCI